VAYNKSDYEALLHKREPVKSTASMEAVRAAPQMQLLTNSEEWNKYLTYLEPIALQAEAGAKDIANQLLSPSLFDTEKIFSLKSEYIRLVERAEVIRTLMTFPKDIIEYGKLQSNPFKDKT